MSLKEEDYILALLRKTPDHKEWLAVAKFGLDTLLKNPHLLISAIYQEAERLHDPEGKTFGDSQEYKARVILGELGLTFARILDES